ncbi:hypothetical protein [Paraburkholderia sacchari]|uniref:hypothetical protein n=1 Tax=Paraburkholderia sacchari TaxID=159450 RepID=UPI0005427DE0|nr:hypothetical protein [Paraburkholderia sacchari]NLP62313.1 hypothetical protein [Paraburkholderia sacchari]
MDNRQHATPAADIDTAVIRLAELAALTNLFSTDEVAAAFGRLDVLERVSIFGALEGMAKAARAALVQGLEVSHG